MSEPDDSASRTAEATKSDQDGRSIAILALLGTALIWGTAAVSTKTVLETYPPFVLACVRWSIALAITTPILLRRGFKPVLDRRTVLLGFTGVLAFNFFFSFGLERTAAANGSVIGGALPVVIAIMSFFFLHERLAPMRWAGIALSMIGVCTTVLGATLDASVLGNILIFGSTIVWSIFTIVNREWLRGENPMAVTVGAAMIGTVMMLPLAIGEAVTEELPRPTLKLALIILYLAIGPSMGAILLWSFALTRVPASTAGVFSNLTPILGIAAAGLIIDEPITRYHLIGAALVLAGVVLTTWSRRTPKPNT